MLSRRSAVDMMRRPQSLSQDMVSSDVARARKVRTVLIACGDKAARVKYWSFFCFALTHKRYRQKTYVDKLHHSSGDAEGARGRLDMIYWQAL